MADNSNGNGPDCKRLHRNASSGGFRSRFPGLRRTTNSATRTKFAVPSARLIRDCKRLQKSFDEEQEPALP
jgi:hypothetical protein